MLLRATPSKIQGPKRLKLNGWGEKLCQANTKQKKVGVAMIMSKQTDF